MADGISDKDGFYVVGRLARVEPVTYTKNEKKMGQAVEGLFRAVLEFGLAGKRQHVSFPKWDQETNELSVPYMILSDGSLVGERVGLRVRFTMQNGYPTWWILDVGVVGG